MGPDFIATTKLLTATTYLMPPYDA